MAISNWRAKLKIHPAADLPRLNTADLRELADDIEKNGLQHQIETLVDTATEPPTIYVLDGCNRLDALELLGRACANFQ